MNALCSFFEYANFITVIQVISLLLIGTFPFGIYGYIKAKKKGYNPWLWFLICIFGNWMACLLLYYIPEKQENKIVDK